MLLNMIIGLQVCFLQREACKNSNIVLTQADVLIIYILIIIKEMVFMQATIQKWGNSQGIRIPKAFLEALGMMENGIVELERSGDNISSCMSCYKYK